MAIRIDKATLRPAKRLPNGTLRADAILTRTGVFEYTQPDGSVRREYRPDSEVGRPESLDSFALVPVTNGHPPEMVTARNSRKYMVGSVGSDVKMDGPLMIAGITVSDADTIAEMDRGKTECSNGYHCDLVETPGVTPQGEAYDAIQTNIRGNHLAIVPAGRAGVARVRMDGAGYESSINPASAPEKMTMDLAQALEALGAAKARADKAEQDVTATTAALAKAEGERDAAKARADKAEQARTDAAKTDAAALDKRVSDRVSLERNAAPVLGADVDMRKMNDREIKAAVVLKLDGATIPATQSDVYVDARYDGAIERVAGGAEALAVARAAAEELRGGAKPLAPGGNTRADDIDEGAARARMEARSANAWKNPIKGDK